MTFRTTKDVEAPTLTVRTKSQRLRTVRRRGATYLARCSERCTGRAELVLTRSTARRLRLPRVIARGRVALDPKPRSSTLRVRLTSRARKRLARHRRTLRTTLVVRVADASRNSVRVRRVLRLRR